MTKMIVNVSNTSDKIMRLVLEPLVHIFPINPSETIYVHIEEVQQHRPIEIVFNGDEIEFYAGGILSAWNKDTELTPQFR
jgi:hypothetical protein